MKKEEQIAIISQIVDVQLDLLIDAIRDEFELCTNKITTSQSIMIEHLNDKLTDLLTRYVNQNK